MSIQIHTHISTPVAVVGLERTFYQVSEDVGVMEVCVIVYSNLPCLVDFEFDVNLTTSKRFSIFDDMAGDEH